MKRMGIVLGVFLLVAASLAVSKAALGQTEIVSDPSQLKVPISTEEETVADLRAAYYSETRHNIRGEMATYFWANGAEARLGRPLSEQFQGDFGETQCFEYFVLGISADDGTVRPLDVGAHLASLAGLATNGVEPELAPELAGYYEAHGGAAWFGRPVSEPTRRADGVVQYFEHTILEWRDDAADGAVTIGDLGRAFVLGGGVPADALTPAVPWMQAELPASAQPVENAAPATAEVHQDNCEPKSADLPSETVPLDRGGIDLAASLRYPQTGLGGQQTVYITTRDSEGHRLGNVALELVVRYPNSDVRSLTAVTSETGRAVISFAIDASCAGAPVIIDVRATQDMLEAATQLDFTPWW